MNEKSRIEGVFPCQTIRSGCETAGDELVRCDDGQAPSIQPASIDLRLGSRGYRIRASVLPHGNTTMEAKAAEVAMAPIRLDEPTLLERDAIYLLRLNEQLTLPATVRGRTNPKSTTGRLDVFTRVLADGSPRYDTIPEGYRGPLWVEIAPQSFSIIVHKGTSLAQLRLARGTTRCEPPADMQRGENVEGLPTGTDLSVNLQNADREPIIAWKARQNAPLFDMAAEKNTVDPREFFDPIEQPRDGRLVLNKGEFYLMASRERVRVPTNQAAELMPFDPGNGEFRVHYAGFFDPGFGCNANGGTTAVMEVRVLGNALQVEHGQVLGRLVYHRLTEAANTPYGSGIGSSYGTQRLALAHQFRKQRQ